VADDERRKSLLKSAEIQAGREMRIRHPLNPASDLHLRPLSELLGMQRVRVTLARIRPGKEAFAYHAHEADEEFVYILSGRGRTQIRDQTFEVGPGDFMAFPTPSVAHHLTNPYDEDLVYLMGGERSRVEVSTFPQAGKRIIFSGSGIWQVDEKHLEPMSLDQWLSGGSPDRDDDR
jgi:uncharacterized cupin superfamily protein